MKGAYIMSANELTSKVRELKELKAMADELAAEITAIEDEIKAEMTARNTEEMTVDVFKIRWTRVTSNVLTAKRLRQHTPTFTHSIQSRLKAAAFLSHKKF